MGWRQEDGDHVVPLMLPQLGGACFWAMPGHESPELASKADAKPSPALAMCLGPSPM